MSDTLFDLTQYQSQSHINYSPDWRDATGTDPAWEQPDLEPDFGANSQEADGDAPTGWQSASEFTLTLKFGHDVEVTFVPCLVGKRRMHEFSFTGPVSPTGFKSHFVLAIEAEEFPHPRDYAQAYAEEIFARFEAQLQHSGKKLKPKGFGDSVPPEFFGADDDSLIEPTMPSDKTPDLNHTPVEVVEQLSPEEEEDRQRLELKVERGIEQVEQTFYQMGKALAALRSRRLYRSTHKNFSNYCQERFHPMTRRKAEYLIVASAVIDELKSANNCSHFPLPTAESQIRCLSSLQPEQWQEVWQTGVTESGGKVPTAKTIKGIVERLKERDTTPPQIHFQQGDVVLIRGLGNPELKKYDGQWALALAINEYSVTIGLDSKDIPVNPKFLEPVEPKYWADIKAVNQRITRLQIECELDPVDDAVLEVLRRRTCFTPRQMAVLQRLEQDYQDEAP